MLPSCLRSISSPTFRGVWLGTVLFWGLVLLSSNAKLHLGTMITPRLLRSAAATTEGRVLRSAASLSQCTAALLSERTAWIALEAPEGAQEPHSSTTGDDNRHDRNGTKWAWDTSAKVQEHCLLLSNKYTTTTEKRHAQGVIFPLESSAADIQSALQNKWIMIVGDSSVRMLHDYLVGRWLGDYQSWPDGMGNHGPKHTHGCSGLDESIKEKYDVPFCHYDVFHQGARVTFIWMPIDLNRGITNMLETTIGTPDFFLVQHGYWETLAFERKHNPTEQELANATKATNDFVAVVDQWTNEIRELQQEYPNAYKYTNDENESAGSSSCTSRRRPHRVWLSSFLPEHHSIDGADMARSLGWDVFNRTKLVDPNTQKPFPNPHMDNEILEIELELLLTVIRSVGYREDPPAAASKPMYW